METQSKNTGNTALAEESSRDAGVYLLLTYVEESNTYAVEQFTSKKDVNAALERIGPSHLPDVTLYKGAKAVEIKTKVSFTF